ncbi:MAG: hypothetical protein WAN60_06525 [Candidatus Sulfotelmatobacter sp.]
MRLGANLLRATLAFDELVTKGIAQNEAANRLAREHPSFDPKIFQSLVEAGDDKNKAILRSCDIDELLPFVMVLEEELRTKSGLLLVAKGQEVTPILIVKLKNFLEKGSIGRKVMISSIKRAKAATA